MVTCFNYLLNSTGCLVTMQESSDFSTLSQDLESVFLTNTRKEIQIKSVFNHWNYFIWNPVLIFLTHRKQTLAYISLAPKVQNGTESHHIL